MAKPTFTVQVEGAQETLKAFRGLSDDLRKTANGELRQAAGDCARGLVSDLQRAAGASGVPVAPRVARSIRVKSDRLPAVQIGGSKRVGRHGAPAAALVWGSETGPAGRVNHFGVAPSAGYWIAPTVERFSNTDAPDAYRKAVAQIQHRYGLA